MKYLHNGGSQLQPLTRLSLTGALAFLAILIATNFGMYFSRMDLTPASVHRYYSGSEEEFRPPRSYQSMLEVTHGHMAGMSMVLLLVTHLFIFLPAGPGTKKTLIVGTFGSAFLGEASGWLVRFADPAFAWLKIGSFLWFQASLTAGVLLIAFVLISPSPNDKNPARTGDGKALS